MKPLFTYMKYLIVLWGEIIAVSTQIPPDPRLLFLCLMGHKPCPPPAPPNGSGASHLPPGFYALVDIVGEGAAGDEAASPLGHVQAAIFQHDLALTDDHQRGPTQLHPFKDVVLCSLEMGRGAKPQVWAWGRERVECILTCLESCLHCH